MIQEKEMWRTIATYPNYEVSSFGRVRSKQGWIDRAGKRRKQRYFSLYSDKHKDNYVVVCLSNENGTRTQVVHKLSLEAFVGPCPIGMERCHKDGDPTNNRIGNLYYGTHIQNMADRDRHGRTVQRGITHSKCKLDEARVKAMREEYVPYSLTHGSTALSKKYGIHPSQVRRVLNNLEWKHVH
jgi:hypothetical protein